MSPDVKVFTMNPRGVLTPVDRLWTERAANCTFAGEPKAMAVTDAKDSRHLLERFEQLKAVANRYEAISRQHDASIDDALSDAIVYFCVHPDSRARPQRVFSFCLQRERSRCLRGYQPERGRECRALLCFH